MEVKGKIIPDHNIIKMYRGVEVKLHELLNLAQE
jgi:hypothetical protein